MPKFFVDKNNIRGSSVYIDGDNVNHIKNVFRMKVGDKLVLCDGCGNDYNAVISDESLDYIRADIVGKKRSETESSIEVVLYQGLPKGSKMDLIIQKNVELGISRIIPVICERTVVKLDDRGVQNRVDRWNKIAREAAKQSGRGVLPSVAAPVTLEQAIDMGKDHDLLLIPYEKEKEKGLKDVLRGNTNASTVGIFIGPEGGFDKREIENAINNGAIPVTLGNRILRTETAAIYMTSIVIYELDK